MAKASTNRRIVKPTWLDVAWRAAADMTVMWGAGLPDVGTQLAQRIHDADLYDRRSDGRVYPWRICA